jgi:hypothetical protein
MVGYNVVKNIVGQTRLDSGAMHMLDSYEARLFNSENEGNILKKTIDELYQENEAGSGNEKTLPLGSTFLETA